MPAALVPDPAFPSRRAGPGAGRVCLDGWPGHEGRSLVAQGPVELIEGDLVRDHARLREALRHGVAAGWTGGLFGWVGFEGEFRFGVFPGVESPAYSAPPAGSGNPGAVPILFEPQMSRADYVGIVRRAQDYIAAGDIYQVNLSYPWVAPWPEGLGVGEFRDRLREASPAPHFAFLDLGGTQVFSASPECFLRMNGRRILTRPIKGTRPRGRDGRSDEDLAVELLGSPKERAELVMITDLERNDLGRVCEFGSVRVVELLGLERHPQVHHLVSTVEGTLRPEVDHLDAFLACFPGGSISGAPKKRALEIIRELEPHRRGLYTGAIGWFGFGGESQFSIAIRTAWREGGRVEFHTGAGIVADSVPELEYEETRHKAAGLLRAAGGG